MGSIAQSIYRTCNIRGRQARNMVQVSFVSTMLIYVQDVPSASWEGWTGIRNPNRDKAAALRKTIGSINFEELARRASVVRAQLYPTTAGPSL